MTARRIVVVGAGPAGTRCAERLAGLVPEAHITLLGEEPGQPYDRVALSRWLADEMAEPDLVTHDSATLANLGIHHLPGCRAIAIDRAAHLLHVTEAAPLPYDVLVLALGAEPVRLPLPGAGLPGVLAYRTHADVHAMLAAARMGGTAVVIGGGLLGLEAAVGLARRGMRATVLHAVDRLMERQLDHAAASRLQAHLASCGVRTMLNARSTAITGEDRVTGIALADGSVVPADLVVMAVGIRPRVALAREAGLAVGRGIVVDGSMRSADPAIFAVGECAEINGACCGLVAPALAQAEIAARNIAGQSVTYHAPAEAAALKVAGAPVWSAGEIDAADAEKIIFDDPTGEYRRLLLREDRLVGAILYGDTGDAALYRDLIARACPIGPLRAALPLGGAFVSTLLAAELVA